MNELRYYFDKRKLATKGSDAAIELFLKKDVFQKCMYDGTNLTLNGTEVFNTIWANVSLRVSLFGNILPQDIAIQKPIKQELFQTWISDTNNSFFSFIQTK